MKIAGSRCLVVGGARRLGRLLAADLVAAGAVVALTSRDEKTARRAAEILSDDRRAVGFAADTTTAEGARRAVRDAACALGGLEALLYVPSGGFTPTAPQETDESAWDASFDVIAKGFFFCACAARDLMVTPTGAIPAGEIPGAAGAPEAETRGVIIAITDLLGIQPWAAFAAHGAAKAAQIHLVKTLARAWATQGVRVCGVAPGPVDLPDDERRAATLRTAARGAAARLVKPDEVAAGVRFCVENDAVTGVNVIVDAGSLITF